MYIYIYVIRNTDYPLANLYYEYPIHTTYYIYNIHIANVQCTMYMCVYILGMCNIQRSPLAQLRLMLTYF